MGKRLCACFNTVALVLLSALLPLAAGASDILLVDDTTHQRFMLLDPVTGSERVLAGQNEVGPPVTAFEVLTTPRGDRMLVTFAAQKSVTVFNLETGETVREVPLDFVPVRILPIADNTAAWIAGDGVGVLVDTESPQPLGPAVPGSMAENVLVARDRIYHWRDGASGLQSYDPFARRFETIPLSGGIQSATAAHDQDRIYAVVGFGRIEVIDTAANLALDSIDVLSDVGRFTPVARGYRAYAAGFDWNSLEVDLTSGRVIREFPFRSGDGGVTFSNDGATAYFASRSGAVALDVASGVVLAASHAADIAIAAWPGRPLLYSLTSLASGEFRFAARRPLLGDDPSIEPRTITASNGGQPTVRFSQDGRVVYLEDQGGILAYNAGEPGDDRWLVPPRVRVASNRPRALVAGSSVYLGAQDKIVVVDAATNTVTRTLSAESLGWDGQSTIGISEDQTRLYWVTESPHALVGFDLVLERPLRPIPLEPSEDLRSRGLLSVSHDGSTVIVVGSTENGQLQFDSLDVDSAATVSARFNPWCHVQDFIAGGATGMVGLRCWDEAFAIQVADGSRVSSTGSGYSYGAPVAFAAGRAFIATGPVDPTCDRPGVSLVGTDRHRGNRIDIRLPGWSAWLSGSSTMIGHPVGEHLYLADEDYAILATVNVRTKAIATRALEWRPSLVAVIAVSAAADTAAPPSAAPILPGGQALIVGSEAPQFTLIDGAIVRNDPFASCPDTPQGSQFYEYYLTSGTLAPDGRYGYIARRYGSGPDNAEIARINISAGRLDKIYRLPSLQDPRFVSVGAEGTNLFAILGYDGPLVRIHLRSDSPIDTIPLAGAARELATGPDPRWLYVLRTLEPLGDASSVTTIDTRSMAIVRNFDPMPGYRTESIRIDPSGTVLYAVGRDSTGHAGVSRVDLQGQSQPKIHRFPTGISSFAITPDGDLAINSALRLTFLSSDDLRPLRSIPLPQYSSAIGLTPDGRFAYVGHDMLHLIDLTTGGVVAAYTPEGGVNQIITGCRVGTCPSLPAAPPQSPLNPSATETPAPTRTPVLPYDHLARLTLETIEVAPGRSRRVRAFLNADVNARGELLNEIRFSPSAGIAARPDGKPDCRSSYTAAFDFLPLGCAPESTCNALLVSVKPNAPYVYIQGSVLTPIYSCLAHADPGAAPGFYPLSFWRTSGTWSRNPWATEIRLASSDGGIIVRGPLASGTPTPTPQPADSVCGAPGVTNEVCASHVRAAPGGRVDIEVLVHPRLGPIDQVTAGLSVAPPLRFALTPDGLPDCRRLAGEPAIVDFGPAINGTWDAAALRRGITVYAGGLRTVIAPSRMEIARCSIDVEANAGAGVYPVLIGDLTATSPLGMSEVIGSPGSVEVVAVATPSLTPSAAASHTATPAATPTRRQETPPPTVTNTPAAGSDPGGSGCAMTKGPERSVGSALAIAWLSAAIALASARRSQCISR